MTIAKEKIGKGSNHTKREILRWNERKENKFKEHLEHEWRQVKWSEIDSEAKVERITGIMKNIAKGLKLKSISKEKEWYNWECVEKRRDVWKYLRMFQRSKKEEHRKQYIEKKKKFKHLIKNKEQKKRKINGKESGQVKIARSFGWK